MRQSYRNLPPIQTGYPLEGKESWFSVIVPVARTNLILNPSFETGTTGYTNISAGIIRITTDQYHGAYALQLATPSSANDGVYYGPITLIAGTTYAFSCKVKGVQGAKQKISFATTGGVDLAAHSFVATGRWQWQWVYYTPTSSTTYRLYLTRDGDSRLGVTRTDGWQCEAIAAGETVSTFISGDEPGLLPNQFPLAYGWNGTPHASTSFRSGLTRAGGMVLPMNRYNFLLTAIIGLGLATPQNNATEYAQLDGGYPDFTRKPTRQFSLTGRLQGRTPSELDRLRSGLGALLDRDRVGLDQPLVLRFQKRGPDGAELSDAALIPAKYAGGLDGNTDNHYGQDAAISFQQYLPYVQAEQEAGAALNVQDSFGDADSIVYRSPSGVWSALGGGAASGSVVAIVRGLDGTIYAGGDFTDMGGVSNTNSIAAWSGSAWSALGTGVSSGAGVDALVVGPDGSLYAAGTFSAMGGVANTLRIAKWNGSAWSALSTGANGEVRALAIGPTGTLYATGDFTTIGGVAANRIASWNGSAWSALSTGLDAGGYALAFDKTGNLYVGGQFGTAGGVTAPRIAKWDGSAFTALTATASGTIDALAFGLDGLLYVGGTFSSIAGVSNTAKIARWNGTAFQPLATGLPNTVNELAVDAAGILHVGGQFTSAGGVSLPDCFARWNGAAWLAEDINLPGAAVVQAILTLPDGSMYVGYSTSGTATTAGNATATNAGTANTYPTVRIKGPTSGTSRIYQLINYTTGRAIYLNYTINAGETAIFRFQPDNLSFTSDFQGNLASTILPGSSESDFFLQPGANSISFYAADGTVTAVLWWHALFVSADGLTR